MGLQIETLQALHRDERTPVLLVDLVDSADVRMTEAGDHFGLAAKTPRRIGVVGQFVGQELEGNTAWQPLVVGLVDDAHPPGTKLSDDAIVRNSVANHRDLCRPRGETCSRVCVFQDSTVIYGVRNSGGRL